MKNEITIDDFAKIDIRIGTILAAERVPDTDRLIVCTVDLGEEEARTVVSGIAHLRDPKELVGTQMPYIANLTPRTIKGIKSSGMLLALGGDDSFALLHPDNNVPPGTAGK
jgi:methionyl-tRNA synthetase